MYFYGGFRSDGKQPQALTSAVPQDDSTGRHQPASSSDGTSSKHHRHDRVSRHASDVRTRMNSLVLLQKRPVVFVIYYSMYGHIERMATEVCAGVESSGCDCRLFQIAETLPAEVLTKMHAKEKNLQIPFIKAEQLPEADGIIFGMPTRFGSAPTQVRALFDQCGAHWMSDALFGKPVSCLSLLLFHFDLSLL